MSKIELHKVSYAVPPSSSGDGWILRNVSLAVEAGESLTILGPSGSGKTTLLRLCNRLIDPSEGEALYEGRPVFGLPVPELRRRVGLVFQTPVLLKDLSLRDNLLFGVHCCKSGSTDEDALAERLMAQVGLPLRVLEQKPEELSVGQSQRLCLARTLATNPDVLLLDEPTSALDPTARLGIERLIAELRRDRALTSLSVTHDLEQARRLGGRAVILIRGELVEEGPIEELLDRPGHELTGRFVSGTLKESE